MRQNTRHLADISIEQPPRGEGSAPDEPGSARRRAEEETAREQMLEKQSTLYDLQQLESRGVDLATLELPTIDEALHVQVLGEEAVVDALGDGGPIRLARPGAGDEGEGEAEGERARGHGPMVAPRARGPHSS